MAMNAVNTSANGLARVDAPPADGEVLAETAPLGAELPVEEAALVVVDAVVLNVARFKVELPVVKKPVEAPLTRLVMVLLRGILIVVMAVLFREAVTESVVDGTVAVMVSESEADELADKAEVTDTEAEEADEAAEEREEAEEADEATVEAAEEAAEDGEPPDRVIRPE